MNNEKSIAKETNQPSEGQLNLISGRDSKGQTLEAVSGFSTTVIQKAFEGKEPVIITGSDEGEALGSRSAVVHNLRSIMAVPINVKNQTIGVVYVDSSLAKGLFNKGDLELLEAVGRQIGVAFEMERSTKMEIEKQRLQNELKVQAALVELSQKIKLLVDNMEQALFAVPEDLLIQSPVSSFSNRLLGEDLIGKNVVEILYKDIPQDSELMGQINTVLVTVFGESSFQWDLINDNLPRKINYQVGETQRVFSIKYSPVMDEDDNVEKIAFVVDDVTELELLELELAEKRKESIFIQQLLECEKGGLANFFTHSQSLLDEAKESIETVSPSEALNLLARQLHTVKGNARLLGLFSISEAFHQIETDFLNQEIEPSESSKKQLETIVLDSKLKLDEFLKVAENFMGIDFTSQDAVQIPLEYIELLRDSVKQMQSKIQNAEYEKLNLLIEKLSEIPFAKSLSIYEKMVTDLSEQLNKPVKLSINCASDVSISTKLDGLLRDCLTHIVRNAVDHGIDSPEERQKSQKAPEGNIKITATEDASQLTIVIADDGRGIDSNTIARLAVERQVVSQETVDQMSENEKRMLIFLPGFSTKDQATDISGRGVGMDVVKTNIETLGGSLKLDSNFGKGSTFTLTVPKYK